MTPEASPTGFPIDFMKREDLVSLVRAAESNLVLQSRVEIFVSIWQLIKAEKRSGTSRGNSILRDNPNSTYNLIQDSIKPENVDTKWKEWVKKRDGLLADAEKEREVARSKRDRKVNSKSRVQEGSHIEDVARFEAAFGRKDALLLANLPNVSKWYAWPKPRKEMLLCFLNPTNGQLKGSTTISATKRLADDSPDGSEGYTERIPAKRVDIHGLTSGAGRDHPIVRPLWIGTGEPFLPIYDGQFSIVGSTDRCIQYRWSAIAAMEMMLENNTFPTTSDALWLYYNVDRSKVQKLPFAELSEMIQQSQHWQQEVDQNLCETACLRLAFPLENHEYHGTYCNIACIVSAADAPQLE